MKLGNFEGVFFLCFLKLALKVFYFCKSTSQTQEFLKPLDVKINQFNKCCQANHVFC